VSSGCRPGSFFPNQYAGGISCPLRVALSWPVFRAFSSVFFRRWVLTPSGRKLRSRARTAQSDKVKQGRIPISDPQGCMVGGPVLTMIFFGLDVLERRPDFAHLLPRDANVIIFRGRAYFLAKAACPASMSF
jgi:hypothetical protein